MRNPGEYLLGRAKTRLIACECSVLCAPMKLLLVLLVWFVMAAILAAGIVMAVAGKLWLLVLGTLGFVLLFSKYGCLDNG